MPVFSNHSQVKLSTIEVSDPIPFAADLFKRSFGAELPDFPKHLILVATDQNGLQLVLGYVHFTKIDRIYLGGGMCVNPRTLRQLPKTTRQQLATAGGAAYRLLSTSVDQLTDCDAVFGYVGHPGAYKIDLAVGFEPTQYPHLIVYWKKALGTDQKQALIQQAHQAGPF